VVSGRVFALLRGFLRGVLEKRVFFGGVLMVKTWWNVAKLWREGGPYFQMKNKPLFQNIFVD